MAHSALQKAPLKYLVEMNLWIKIRCSALDGSLVLVVNPRLSQEQPSLAGPENSFQPNGDTMLERQRPKKCRRVIQINLIITPLGKRLVQTKIDLCILAQIVEIHRNTEDPQRFIKPIHYPPILIRTQFPILLTVDIARLHRGKQSSV